jgi:hypothetical protein
MKRATAVVVCAPALAAAVLLGGAASAQAGERHGLGHHSHGHDGHGKKHHGHGHGHDGCTCTPKPPPPCPPTHPGHPHKPGHGHHPGHHHPGPPVIVTPVPPVVVPPVVRDPKPVVQRPASHVGGHLRTPTAKPTPTDVPKLTTLAYTASPFDLMLYGEVGGLLLGGGIAVFLGGSYRRWTKAAKS